MNQDLLQRTCQSFSLPLYALIHDTIVQALEQSKISKDDTKSILKEIPKLFLNSKEQSELENAKGAIELEDSFGSGNFFVVDSGSKEAFVFTDQKNADFVNQLFNQSDSKSDKEKSPDKNKSDDKNAGSTEIKADSIQVQSASQGQGQNQSQTQTQSQGSPTNDFNMLSKMMLLQSLFNNVSGNEQKNSRGTIKLGQKNKSSSQNLLQQAALLELFKDANMNDLVKLLQADYMFKQFVPGQGQQAQGQGQQGQGQPEKQGQDQQGIDMSQLLQELQLMNVLQRQN